MRAGVEAHQSRADGKPEPDIAIPSLGYESTISSERRQALWRS